MAVEWGAYGPGESVEKEVEREGKEGKGGKGGKAERAVEGKDGVKAEGDKLPQVY